MIADVILSALRLRLAIAVASAFLLGGATAVCAHRDPVAEHGIFGVTVDDLGRLPAVLDSLQALPRRPWVRVVFDVDPNHPSDPTPYSRKVGEVAAVGHVLGELVDSADIRRLTVAQTKARAVAYVRALRSAVSVWEIGNEVNGDWTGAPGLVARKVQVTYGVVRRLGGRAALTLYENEGCGDGPGELSPVVWSERYLPAALRRGVAYVLLSYYEGQCRGLRPTAAAWTRRFSALHRLFPNARVGFGEIGMPRPATPSTRAAAASVISYYYGLPIRLRYYAGGGFYWYFAEDMVPWRRSLLWRVLAKAWSAAHTPRLSADGAAGRVIPPPPHAAFSYQIGGPFRPAPGVQVVDRDWHVTPAPRAYGICYINAFQTQPEDLSWWRSRHPSLLLRRDGRPVIDAAWNEQLLDTSTPAKRRLLARIIGGWIDRCARAGYRAVEPDNLDSWTRSRGMLTAVENLAFARLLILRAHAAGLAIAQKNAAEFANAGRRLGFDFAIAEECQPFQECGNYLSAYGDRVIEIEYPDDGGERNFLRACRLRGDRISIVSRDRDVTPAGHPGFIERRCPPGSAAG
jgi:hypothetical protein